MDDNVINWLLEDNNLAVKYRTQSELLCINNDELESTKNNLLSSDLITSVMKLFDVDKNFSDSHALSALAEYDLTRTDVDIDRYVERYIEKTKFRDGCGEGFLLRNLIILGYKNHSEVEKELPKFLATQQNDGGFPCISANPKINKPNTPHKSCFQMTVSCLLLTAEMKKRGMECPQIDGILYYFLNRDVLYRHDDSNVIVKAEMGTTFHPPVCTRIGLHMILNALSIIDARSVPTCNRVWELLESKRDNDGKYILDNTLTKPYIKMDRIGKPSKWVTFYALLAKKHCNIML